MSDNSKAAIFDEMLAAQKSRDELMKWKLIVISTIGAAGLGLFESKCFGNLHLILAVIPVACVYVDMLCRNLSLRTKRINTFISTLSDPNNIDVKYARFYLTTRRKAGKSFESHALFWSTIFISALLSGIGLQTKDDKLVRYSFIITGLMSIAISILLEIRYRYQKKRIEKLSNKDES